MNFKIGQPKDPLSQAVSNAGKNFMGTAEDIGGRITGSSAAKIPTPKTQPIERTEIGGMPDYTRQEIDRSQLIDAKGITVDMKGDSARRAMEGALSQYQDLAAGKGNSLAQMQLRQGMESNIASQMAAMRSGRGGANPAMARAAMREAARSRGQMAGQAAQLRMQEQMEALGGIAGVGRDMRTGDINIAQADQKAKMDAHLANVKQQLDLAIEQGRMDAGRASEMYRAEVGRTMTQASLDQQRLLADAGYGNAAMMGQWQMEQAEGARSREANRQMYQDILSGVGKAGMTYALGG
jgi:hypothetical protein